MTNTILLPLDGTKNSERALELAKSFARSENASIIVFGCVEMAEMAAPGYHVSAATFTQNGRRRGAELKCYLQGVTAQLNEEGFEADFVLAQGQVVNQIVKCADEREVDLIVLDSPHRSGLRRFFHRSVAENVRRQARCRVVICSGSDSKGNDKGGITPPVQQKDFWPIWSRVVDSLAS